MTKKETKCAIRQANINELREIVGLEMLDYQVSSPTKEYLKIFLQSIKHQGLIAYLSLIFAVLTLIRTFL